MAELSTTRRNPQKRQDNDKTAKRPRVRSGVNTVAFWKSRLFRNSYRDRNGNTVEIPEWYVRMRHAGVTKRVRLRSADRDQAAEYALRLFNELEEGGWQVALDRQSRLPSSPSIAEFCDLYREAAKSMERPPRPLTINLYCRCLSQICRFAQVRELRQLDGEAIERGRDAYRAFARKQGRTESAIQNTLSKVLRNAAACFSLEARGILKRKGLDLENPFEGIRKVQDIQPVHSLPAEVVQRIWEELPLLRDGGTPKGKSANRSSRRRRQDLRKRTLTPGVNDLSGPRPESYAAILLALGAGLRANEIDKARWSWFQFDAKDKCYLVVRAEPDFRPKGGTARTIRLPRELFDAIVASRQKKTNPYVLGGEGSELHSVVIGERYRCPKVFKIANAWLRLRGVEEENRFGNPLHRLRKQFGSEVATQSGLFAAQKLLGHSSPIVTAKYYAAQTDLPELTHIRIARK